MDAKLILTATHAFSIIGRVFAPFVRSMKPT